MFWTPYNVRSILMDLMQKVLPQLHRVHYRPIFLGNDWSLDYGLSSMQIVELSAYVNSFFNFLDVEQAPNLLIDTQIDNWVNKILAVRKERDAYITFQSSGTSGISKSVTHSIESINTEVAYLKTIINKPSRVLSYVPSNHIYGFLFTIVLPQSWNIPVVKASQLDSLQFQKDDLIVATPFNWQFIYSSLNNIKMELSGISSGAPLNDGLYKELENKGIAITEIYGSTETAGIGFRHNSFKAFELYPYWAFSESRKSIVRKYDFQEFQLLDQINLLPTYHFTIGSRIDEMIQIGGVNISLKNIQEKLLTIKFVTKALVYAKSIGTGVLIGVTISLTNQDELTKLKCVEEMNRLLDPLEIPTNITFVS